MGTPQTAAMMAAIRAERVETWFDLGLLLDRLREDREVPGADAPEGFDDFIHGLEAGIAIVTFDIGVDGVSMEIAKYAEALRGWIPGARVHYVAGRFAALAGNVIDDRDSWHCVEGMDGFDRWPLYGDFFDRKLERGGPLYNDLISRLWAEALDLTGRLGEIVENHDVRLLLGVNTNSNPGNIALALAMVFVSEYLRVPVVNNCHDFYWEGGRSRIDREVHGWPRGPRDHFFANAHVGEIFSLLETLFPWDSRSWMTVCINQRQVDTLRERLGFCPANLARIGTAVDTDRYTSLGRSQVKSAWRQVVELLSNGRARLKARAVADVLERGRLAEDPPRPILIAAREQGQVDFRTNNTVLLQPTRIIARKKIGVSFKLIARLLQDEAFAAEFREDPTRKITLLVTGPVALGNGPYLERIVRQFAKMLADVDPKIRDQLYFACLFSAFDDPAFLEGREAPLDMPALYNVASLVVLPSETEGRGLPILESAACGVSIVSRRYEPKEVFSEVVGENLAREERLDVIAFEGSRFEPAALDRVRKALLSREWAEEKSRHNRSVIEARFSMAVLREDVGKVLRMLHLQLQPDTEAMARAARAFERFGSFVAAGAGDLGSLIDVENREYLPGFGRMGFMLRLKSLIDPSDFRVEEQGLRGMAFEFAHRLEEGERDRPLALEEKARFYDAVDSLFRCRSGELEIQVDHSLAYRHRNRVRYSYRDLTPQELTGVIALLYGEHRERPATTLVDEETSHLVTGWDGMVGRCCGAEVVLDDRKRLRDRIGGESPFALVLGPDVHYELEVFVLESLRMRLGLGVDEEIGEQHAARLAELAPITIIERSTPLPGGVSAELLETYLAEGGDEELALLHRLGVCRVVSSEQLSVGLDLRQLGVAAREALRAIREAGGFLVALCEQAAMTTDCMAMERYHLGRADDPLTANILGIPEGAGYVQWVPAGLRPTLAYPTPIQTAKTLSEALSSRRFKRLCKRLGERAVLAALERDAGQRGSPVADVLEKLARSRSKGAGPVSREALNGIYADGCPWSGVLATVPASRRPLRFGILSSDSGNQTVPEFVRRFNRDPRRRARVAWNGGYILNAELVGKLGLPESYIGSPLGLIISKGRMLSPPLFGKPAFVVREDRSLEIRRVSCEGGLVVRSGRTTVELGPETRNPELPGDAPCFYDLMAPGEAIPGEGRTLVRLVGNRIMEIRETSNGENLPVLPVGLVLSFAPGTLPSDWEVGRRLVLQVEGLTGIADAVEAGPLLVEKGQVCIDMELEGWKTRNSILTQAARLDYLDMRGPKIAIGLDDRGTLEVLAVNGRIRESVGATHGEMAQILADRGMRVAMGFDPGGSATLVVGSEILNISPYNHRYEHNVYAMSPEPRGVANAVVGY